MSDLSTDVMEIRSAIRECFEANKGPLSMRRIKKWIAEEYKARFDPLVVYAQVKGSCRNLPRSYTRKDRIDAPKILYYDRSSKTHQLISSALEGSTTDSPASILREDVTLVQKRVNQQATFVLESHLRDYLAKNLHALETGLELYALEPSAVEFCVEGRFIDILAKDVTGTPVVIELKVRKAYDRVIGQALLYRTLIENKLGVDRVRVILVAEKITKELRLATKHVVDLNLFQYKLSMQVSPVANN